MRHEEGSSLLSPESRPAALMLAEAVEEVRVGGEFNSASQTWSNRDYACASAKKHNEGM